MSISHKKLFLDSLFCSYEFAKKFNEDVSFRFKLVRIGAMASVPTLLKQEIAASKAISNLFGNDLMKYE